jgi:hypothetical protein
VRFSAFFNCNGDALYFGLFAYKISHLSKKKKLIEMLREVSYLELTQIQVLNLSK